MTHKNLLDITNSSNCFNSRDNRFAVRLLVATLIVTCALQAVTLMVVTARIGSDLDRAEQAFPNCDQDFTLRPKFPRPFPDGCTHAPIRHLKEA